VLPDGGRALIPGGERSSVVTAELAQELSQVRDSDSDIPGSCSRDPASDQDGLDVAPRSGHDLHDAPGADRRREIGLEARLHPRDRTDESAVDAVMGGPEVEQYAHLRCRGGRANEDRLRFPRCATGEGGKRPRSRGAVDREPARPLKMTECAGGSRVEVAADRDELAAACEQELQHGDVPTNKAPVHGPLPEERPSKWAEGAARRASHPTVDLEVGASLEEPDPAAGRGTGDPVDWAGVEAVSA